MIQPATRTLDVPGVLLTYDVRRNDSSKAPILFLIGSPMAAGGFGTLAGHFTDRTVVTYDQPAGDPTNATDAPQRPTPVQPPKDRHGVTPNPAAGPVGWSPGAGR